MAEEAKASAKALDFTNVKDGGGAFNKKRQEAGDYKAKVTRVVDSPSKKDGTDQWLFTIQVGAGTYPYYCKLVANQLWKVRNLFMAAGLNVPKKKLKVDPTKVVGKSIAVTLDDDEYDDGDKVHLQSVITATFPLAELDGVEDDEDNTSDDDGDDDEDEEETPPKKSKSKPVEDDDEDDEDDEDEAPPPPKKKKAAPEPEDDDDEEDEDDEPEPPKKKKSKAEVDDDDLDELDIDDM